jgi:hypothetical protein
MQPFTEEDRRIFQMLIDHHLDSIETIGPLVNMGSVENVRYYINLFCEKYQCIVRTQILSFEKLGLHPFFQITESPLEHPYVVRQFQLFGNQTEYLSLCVAPDVAQIPPQSKEVYPITKIYRPTNNIRLLYEEARGLSFNDEWLLNLKEVMVEQEMGDIMYQQEESVDSAPMPPINPKMLDQIEKLYLNDSPKLYDYRLRDIARNFNGLLSTYLDIKLPSMTEYLLILDDLKKPKLFAGGFIGRFPLVELYEAPNTLICRILTPEANFSKFNMTLFMHLREVCMPSLWLLLEDRRKFDLQGQWGIGRWK